MRSSIPTKPILVLGATGAIGREVVRALLDRGAPVRVLVRDPKKVAALPALVERLVGDLTDPSAFAQAMWGVHAAFFVVPHDAEEEQIAGDVISAANFAGVRVVFAGVHADGATRAARFVNRTVFGLMLPHYAAKLRISERVRRDCPGSTVLMPANYYQNDEICRDEILAGTLPLPLRGCPRVDTRDVGDAAARALLDPAHRPGAYSLVGPEALSGEETCSNWTAALGRPVRYAPSIDAADAALDRAYGGRKALDFQKTYRLLARITAKVTPAQLLQTTELLGRPPRSHAEYTRDVVASWRVTPPVRARRAERAPRELVAA